MSFSFSLADVDFLTSGPGRALLADLAHADVSEAGVLRLLPSLRGSFSPGQTSAAIETTRLRQQATEKFGPVAADMLFTAEALQQASDPLLRAWRGSRWDLPTVDVCCGIGTDTFAFARAAGHATGVDVDPVRVAMARYNAAALRLPAEFYVMDVTQAALPVAQALFYDPARRDEAGQRLYNVEQYIPPLSMVKRWMVAHDQVEVKLSPGVNLEQLQGEYTGKLTFVSVGGHMKEAILSLYPSGSLRVDALLLLGEHPDQWHTFPAARAATISPAPLAAPRRWLCEPDPAIIRAGYVAHLAATLDGTMLDDQIAYFTTDTRPVSPWVRAWEILDWMPFHLKRLRAHLRQQHVGRVTVKKRGSPLTPGGLARKLKLKGSATRTLVLTRLQDAPVVLICRDYLAT